MNTNEQAQAVLGIISSLASSLYAASRDGKIEVKEVVSALLGIVPSLMALIGPVETGN